MAKRVDSSSTGSVDRREFLKGAAAGAAGAAGAIVAGSASAQQGAPANARPSVARPTEADARADFVPPEPRADGRFIRHPGSDYMVDVLKALDFDYVAVNPGSAFEGLHESLINHGGNRKPEILTVLHEEAGAAMAHGYAKAAGRDPSKIAKASLTFMAINDDHAKAIKAVEDYVMRYYGRLRADVADTSLIGPPAAIIDRIGSFLSKGLDTLIIGLADPDPRQLDLFGEKVLPKVN